MAQYGVATSNTKLDCVQIDGLVVLKIIKHCRYFSSKESFQMHDSDALPWKQAAKAFGGGLGST